MKEEGSEKGVKGGGAAGQSRQDEAPHGRGYGKAPHNTQRKMRINSECTN